ncbi:MAG TPA: DegT/DnrJ/EryC1/StrS family aminotransferase [Thermomicrobiales bacterium]|jgi:dTDP-4-amino-4,6-dideoxygalactose transaminase|nr:DegT/DnrJ/EryC1/StrS family aminotransferase [Thermomicrobiales bacterium]
MTAQLAIDGGAPIRREPFPEWPIFGNREEQLLLEVLHSGKWGELTGSKVVTFARDFAAFQGAAYGVCVPNGTLALEVGLEALGVGHADEIITTAYTFIATASSAFAVGARPIFVDIDPETNNIDPARIAAAITPRTKAIVPVHIGGQPADMDGVMEVARAHGIPVLEDACQAWGAAWRGTPVGAIGDLGCFSFQASKNITAGEGGIVVTNSREHYTMAWSLHNVGRLPEGGWYQHELLGRNLRMSEWQGAILTAQLERLPDAMALRQRNAARLTEGLADVPGLAPVKVDARVTSHAWHLYQIRYDPARFGGRGRDEFLKALQAEGIPCSGGYVPLTYQAAIQNTLRARFGEESLANLAEVPRAEHAGGHTVWLTQTMLLGEEADIDQIAEACRKIQRAWGE